MNKFQILSVSLLATLSTLPAFAGDPVGRMTIVDGGVVIQRDLATDVGRVGSIIGTGDTVVTTDTGQTQWQMADEALFVLGASSGLKINSFEMPSANNRLGQASYTLVQGSVHALTGKIGHEVAQNETSRATFAAFDGRFNSAHLIKVAAAPVSPYSLMAAFARVTTKGAEFAVRQTAKTLAVLVQKGAVTVCNAAGCASPGAGMGALVSCPTCKPILTSRLQLGLDFLLADLRFDLTDRDVNFNVVIGSPRVEPAPPPGQTCVDIAAQLQAGTCVPGGPGVPPVSPN